MYRWERTMRDGGFGLLHEREIPSFSSSLLDEIYRSIDEEGGPDLPREQANMVGEKKQSKCGTKAGKVEFFDRMESVKAGALVEKRAKERETIQRRQVYPEPEKKPRRDRYFDHDALFISSTSSSSDSSSNGFSSSDTESAYSGLKTRTSCFVPLPRPKPVRTSVATRPDRTGEKTEFSPFQEQRKLPGFDGGDEGMINSKSRALKIYSNLKKMKRPISPGGKLASFFNSLFAAGNTPRKAKQSAMSALPYSEEENPNGKFKSGNSSASSFSRSCLSKHSPATLEKLRNGSKRTVQFYPMSVILDEDSRTCGERSLHQEREESEKENLNKARPVSFPAARNPGTNVHRKITDETRHNPWMDRSSQAEETAREFLRNYHRNQKKIEESEKENLNKARPVSFPAARNPGTNIHRKISDETRHNPWMDRSSQAQETTREFLRNYHRNQKKIEKTTTVTSRGNHRNSKNDDRDYEDDTASCTSSDLFELDHLSVLGNDMYCKELPVYGTTHVGLIM